LNVTLWVTLVPVVAGLPGSVDDAPHPAEAEATEAEAAAVPESSDWEIS
jgi:hypothetical protein